MRKVLAILVALAMIAPAVLATDTGIGLEIDLSTEDFKPLIWMCDSRVVFDDGVQPGRMSPDGTALVDRITNYAFEGEQISWKVLVMDKNGIEKIRDVFVTVGPVQGNGQFIEANCQLTRVLPKGTTIDPTCNARIDEEELLNVEYDNTMAEYTCLLTVETPASMHGQFWVTANVEDLDGQIAHFAENEYWFFNPTISITLSGLPLSFGTVRPGTQAYSNTITVGNGAEMGSGVMLDMFVSGTDFYDPANSGAKCPTSNQLELSNFRYYAVNGAYSTATDLMVDLPAAGNVRNRDGEGYVNIEYGTGFNNPVPFYDNAEMIQSSNKAGNYYLGNELSPGSEMSVTFKLSLPEPCNGDFSDGHIFFWGEAI